MASKDKKLQVAPISIKRYAIGIFLLVFLVYGSSIKNRYALDDNYVTVTDTKTGGNPFVAKGFGGIKEIFTSHFVETKEQSFEYRPVPLSMFAIEYAFFGSNPHVNHFMSILVYALTCVLLFFILRKLFNDYNILLPFLVTLLFLFHPIHTEVVYNIKCRDELLAFFFGLCALHFFLKNSGGKSKFTNVLLTCVFLLLAILSKKTAIIFIAVIPLVSYFFSGASLRNVALQLLLFYMVFVFYTLMERFLLPPSTVRVFAFFENPLFYDHEILTRLKLSLVTIGFYFKLMVFPYPLCSYYGYDTISTDTNLIFIVVTAIMYLCLAGYAFVGIRKRTPMSFAILVFLVGLFPFSNLVDPMVGIVAERFVYVASLGFCIMAAIVLFKVFKVDILNKKMNFAATSLSFRGSLFILFFMCGVASVARSNSWKDSITLLRKDAERFPESCNLHYLVGTTLYPQIMGMKEGSQRSALIKEAKFHYGEAAALMIEGLKKYSTDFTTTANVGSVFMNIFNQPQKAQYFFKRSIEQNPTNAVAQFNYVFCYEKQNLLDSAIVGYERLAKDSVTYVGVFVQLNDIYLKNQQYDKAIAVNKIAVSKYPTEPRLFVNLGNAQILAKDSIGAQEAFKRAIELDPGNTSLRAQVDAFLKRGK